MSISEKMGYQPNLAGKALRTGKTYEIAIMLPFDRQGSASAMGAAQYDLIAGFSSVLNSSGYNMKLIAYTHASESLKVFESYLSTNRPDAFVVTQLEPQDKRLELLINKQIPFITFGKSDLPIPHHSFDFDNYEFTFQATNDFIAQGKKRILFVVVNDNYMHYIHQINGFTNASKEHSSKAGYFFDVIKVDANDDKETLASLNNLLSDCDAVITVSVHLTYLIKKSARNLGITIGKELTLCCSTATPSLLQMLDIPVKCYFQDFSKAGEIFSRLAINVAENPNLRASSRLNSYEIINI